MLINVQEQSEQERMRELMKQVAMQVVNDSKQIKLDSASHNNQSAIFG